ncbi:hypothetical protein KIN20_033380 [Parelaphostrongylus tenuis]|uniref:Uncharacterized protein n=1 Tax=Parelaphostrongylus tenuis TaxID=148309 RepID=A0AAD5R7Y9_PARTN|nr:hypothetical protein KIN20_033380 [Parelaphostrongylus tenuis]
MDPAAKANSSQDSELHDKASSTSANTRTEKLPKREWRATQNRNDVMVIDGLTRKVQMLWTTYGFDDDEFYKRGIDLFFGECVQADNAYLN